MHGTQFFTLIAAAYGLAACGPFLGRSGTQPITGDYALRTHGHGTHAAAALDTDATKALPPVAAASDQDSLAAANRARADSIEQSRLAALAVASRAHTDSLERTSVGLRDELAGLVYFDFDRAEIQPLARATLDRKAAILSANPTVRVRIDGYCDERGSDEYNLALGERRAAAAKRYLVARGIGAGRLDAVSFGSTSPVDHGRNEAAWAMNRRAGFEIISGADTLTAPAVVR